jgi:cyanophycinase
MESMMKAVRSPLRILLLPLLFAACAPAVRYAPQPEVAVATGPDIGALVIAGGGELLGSGILERFLELAGGPDASIVVIPTADGASSYTEDWSGLQALRAAGARNITILHTYDPETADRDEFVAPLRAASGVWFPGGRQFRLAEAYLGTRTLEEVLNVLDRGGVVGGSSAGASIQGSYLVRGAREGNHIVMSPGHDEGFGLLQNTAIDQHLIVRRRERDLLQVLAARPELLGIGIDESTAIVVQGDAFEVVGASRVAIYDGSPRSAADGYYFLDPGARYNLRYRTPELLSVTASQ